MRTLLGKSAATCFGRYRYSKLRWRILVRIIDVVGTLLMALWRCVRKPAAAPSPRKILLIQIDHLGDAILSSPMIARLREEYPEATLDVLASPSNHQVFRANEHVDGVIVATRNWFEREPHGWASWSVVWTLGLALRRAGYDLAIDVRGDILSVIVIALAGIPRRVGWTMGGGGFLLTDYAPWVPNRHEVRSRMALLECLGLDGRRAGRVEVFTSDDARLRIKGLLYARDGGRNRSAGGARNRLAVGVSGDLPAAKRLSWDCGETTPARPSTSPPDGAPTEAPVVALHLGAGTLAKRWPIGHWSTLVRMFVEDGWRVVLVGGPEDAALAGALPADRAVLDLCGQLSVVETKALLEQVDLFIGADSGPAHLAAAAGTRSVILFSGTNCRRQWRPWSREALVLRARVACSPCHQKVCPLPNHDCMTGISPQRVFKVARRWFHRRAKSSSLDERAQARFFAGSGSDGERA